MLTAREAMRWIASMVSRAGHQITYPNPFSARELLARLRVAQRLSRSMAQQEKAQGCAASARLVLDVREARVHCSTVCRSS